MKIKTALSALLIVALVSVLGASAVPAAAKGKGGPVVLATDPADDWGSNAGVPAPLGDVLGQEITEAQMHSDGKNVHFIIKLNSLPPNGGVPEASRYNWDFTMNGTAFQLTGGWTEFLRGVCNPLITSGGCPPPQNPGLQPFFLRQGPCTVGAECAVLATYQATFDPAAATITIAVPFKDIKAKPGAKIGPGASTFGGAIYAAPAALVSSTGAPADIVIITKSYKIPK
jgi:hypothetical protein